MWNIVLSLCLLPSASGTPKAGQDFLVTATKRVTKAGGLVRGKVRAAFVKKEMSRKQVEAILGEPGMETLCGCAVISCYHGGARVFWGHERVTINGQDELQDRAWVIGPSLADIWAALTGGDERRQ
jgi:hypothetical protein